MTSTNDVGASDVAAAGSAARARPRPLSPHIQLYRWQITMVLSILHRATGIVLSAGTLLLVWWIWAAASGGEAFATVQGFIGSPIGLLLLAGWSWSIFYHLLNGIRHLAWDAGWGFELPTMTATGWAVVVGSVALTLVAWVAGLMLWGA